MLNLEAVWIGKVLDQIPVGSISPLINLGSSTKDFRERGQPFITEHIIQPLLDRGVEIIHVDLFDGDRVDIAGDIFEDSVFNEIKSHRPNGIICANVLEHVVDPLKLAERCIDIVGDGRHRSIRFSLSFSTNRYAFSALFNRTWGFIRWMLNDSRRNHQMWLLWQADTQVATCAFETPDQNGDSLSIFRALEGYNG